MRIDVLTLFPGIFEGYLSESILEDAIERGLLEVNLYDMRQWARDKHNTMDDRPFGGGPGMVLKVDRVVPCVEEVQTYAERPGRVVMLTPQGRLLTQRVVEELASEERLILLCGRYEGFDQRIVDILRPDEISIGDYVLNGGEVAAAVIVDSVMRLIPGVLGDEASAVVDSFSSGNRLLEEDQYTRPREYRGLRAPEILLSGDHGLVDKWREINRLEKTFARRPDLLDDKASDN
ncbi:MAG: tRNA (guanosine(37)-N1)-methyltransferase TrmD [Thermoguttaceae bacterium]|nr:tRNA (guanosine(37)-N1)-methyltransferase TrmD [Thermoguttaceae bacterium]MBR5759530.1 tRNA (guanosine(37)-N1)-methyltransferase TrmD [Thermoguttaceae bacterium]